MKNISSFFSISLLMISFSLFAHEEVITPAAWDQQSFASLTSDQKKDVIGIVQVMQKYFQEAHDSVDKGVDSFIKSYAQIVECYDAIRDSLLPRPEICTSIAPLAKIVETSLPTMKALEILPSADLVWQPIKRFLATKGPVDEKDPKRSLSKVFRNKEAKAEIKAILKKQCAALDVYVNYINTHYAQDVADLAVIKERVQVEMQELLAKLQEQQGMQQ